MATILQDTQTVFVAEPKDFSQVENGVEEVKATPANPLIVTWENETDPANPYNWSPVRKWFTTLLTSLGGFVTLMSGAMLAPTLSAMSADLHISESEASMALSIYVLAFAFGPMVLAPCSEVWGRRPIWIVGGSWYVLWNTICGISKNRGLMITGRLMAGLGASAEFAVSAPIVADIWTSDERGKSMAIRGFLPLLGPAIGPIIGGAMVQYTTWRWTFHVLSVFNAVVVLLFAVALPETYAPTLLSRKAAYLRKTTGESYYAAHESDASTLGFRMKTALVRPVRMLVEQPVIQLVALIMGYQFGLLYIVLATFAGMWTKQYNQSASASGLHYLAIVIGYLAALQGGGWATDRLWAYMKAKYGGETRPENRVPLMIPGAILTPIGLLWYGWAAETQTHWIVVDIGIAVFGFGYIIGGNATAAYVVEAFLGYTASAQAASQLPRSVFAFVSPIFAPSLYNALGYGVGNSVLALIACLLGLPTPWILWKYGERLRMKGKTVV